MREEEISVDAKKETLYIMREQKIPTDAKKETLYIMRKEISQLMPNVALRKKKSEKIPDLC